MKTTVNKTQSFFKGMCVKSASLRRTVSGGKGAVAFEVLGLLLVLVLIQTPVITATIMKSASVISIKE